MSGCTGLSCQPRSPHHMLRDVQLLPGTSHPSEELAQQQESTLLLWATSLPTLHKSLLMSLIFLVCKMSISSKTNHFGTISTITEQPLFSTLENTSPSTSRKSHSYILHFIQTYYFRPGKCHLVYTSRVPLQTFSRHLQHLPHFKPSPSRDDLEPVLFRKNLLAQQLT